MTPDAPLIGRPWHGLEAYKDLARSRSLSSLGTLAGYPVAMPNIGPVELGIVLLIILLIFGPKRLPGLGRQLGSGMREFKDSITGKDKDDDDRPSTADDSRDAFGDPRALDVAPAAQPEPADRPPPVVPETVTGEAIPPDQRASRGDS